MADVAARAGVSRALVSIVFRNQPGASAKTRERVLHVADQLGYRPDNAARLLARSRSRTLGVMLTMHQSFHADLIEGIYPEAERLGYDVLLSAAAPTRSENKAVDALLSHRCEALILLGSGAEPAYLDKLGRHTAVVMVSRRVPQAHVDCVHSAEGKGIRQAMNHLVQLGHQAIVHLDGGRGPGSAERRRAYRTAMRHHGLHSEIRVITGEYTEQAGIDAARELLTERDRGAPLPTGILASNDCSAMGLLMTLIRAGVEVPRDVSIIGYDDSHISDLMPVGLTTVRQDAVLMAQRAVRFVVERLEDPTREPREAVLEPKLVVRGTTGPAHQHRNVAAAHLPPIANSNGSH